MLSRRTPRLLVAGAGPAGLSAALAARSLGVEVTVLEAGARDRARPGSRALFVHRETLRRLDRMSSGLGAKIGEFGVRWQAVRCYHRGRRIFARDHAPQPYEGLPPYASLRQLDTERFLLDACHAAGAEVEWSAEVADVRTGPDGVAVRTIDGREWAAAYLIGADGSRSAVRRSLGITLDGGRSSDYRVAVDLAEDPRGPLTRVMHYRHPAMDGRNLLIIPFTGGRQVDVQCRTPADAEHLSHREEVERWLPEVAGPGAAGRILWIARYPCLQLVAGTFLDPHRRALLAGEAAHLFAPLGARGMNSAIADADAAARAVALALHATPERARAVVEDYERVRRRAAEFNRAAAGSALGHLRAATAADRARQAVAARLAPLVPRLGAWLDDAPYGPRGGTCACEGRY